MKNLFLLCCILTILGSQVQADPIFENKQSLQKAKVTHIFSDFVNRKHTTLAKVQLSRASERDQFTIIEIPETESIQKDDLILIRRVEVADTFGLGDSLENTFEYVDRARDGIMGWLFMPFLLFPLFFSRNNQIIFITILLNIIALGFIYPTLSTMGTTTAFIVILALANFIGGYLFLGSSKFLTVALTSIVGASLTSFGYWLIMLKLTLTETQLLNQHLALNLPPDIASEIIGLTLFAYFTNLFITLFFTRVSYKRNIYTNFKTNFMRIFFFYFLLFLLFNYTTIHFFYSSFYRNIFFYLFNYKPFIINSSKIVLCFTGNILATFIYLLAFYIKNKQHFHKQIPIADGYYNQAPNIAEILKDQRFNRYDLPTAPKRNAIKKPAQPPTNKKSVKKSAGRKGKPTNPKKGK